MTDMEQEERLDALEGLPLSVEGSLDMEVDAPDFVRQVVCGCCYEDFEKAKHTERFRNNTVADELEKRDMRYISSKKVCCKLVVPTLLLGVVFSILYIIFLPESQTVFCMSREVNTIGIDIFSFSVPSGNSTIF